MTQNNTIQSGQCKAMRAALAAQRNLWKKHDFPAYIGLDVHKETVAVSVARCGRRGPEQSVEIPNTPPSIRKLVKRLNEEFHGQFLLFCYEAGPCGYVLYRQLRELGRAVRRRRVNEYERILADKRSWALPATGS